MSFVTTRPEALTASAGPLRGTGTPRGIRTDAAWTAGAARAEEATSACARTTRWRR
jgi:hypothetical protein